jgi:hypothetical protein
MYSCYDGYVVFGVMESERDAMLERDWLEENFPSLNMYASDVVRNHMGNAVYGISVHLDKTTGQACVSAENKAEVMRLHELLCNYYARLGDAQKPGVGFFTVVSGDYTHEQHCEYIPE